MAGGQERILRGRIRTVQATKKITRAMELIAASRIVKAQQRVAAAVPYSDQITEVVKDLAAAGGSTASPLLAGRETVGNVAYVVITADRGLCGGYNAGVQRAAEGEIKADVLQGRDYSVIAVGRKAESYFRFRGYKIKAKFAGFSDAPSYADAKRSAQHVVTCSSARSTESNWSTHGSSQPDRKRSSNVRWCRSSATPLRVAMASRLRTRQARRPTSSTSPIRPPSSTRCCRSTSRPASTRHC
jgi:F-type H+-transporting ATPase subunit gamma